VKEKYDVLVVGAGPAGSLAAKTAAKEGLSVLLIEKHREIGVPVCCAEGVSRESLAKYIEPDPKFISQAVEGGRLFSPDGTEVVVRWPGVGYILDRKAFDAELARRASQAGAEVRISTQATGMGKTPGGWKVSLTAFPEDGAEGRPEEVEVRVVIGADGVESLVGRWAGIPTEVRMSEVHSCMQYLVEDPSLGEDELVTFYVGRDLVPGGYAWSFPKGKGRANVGLGLVPTMVKDKREKAGDYQKRFVERFYPRAGVLERTMGGVPANNAPQDLVADGVLLVGDAGRLTDSLSGAGIAIALETGALAGEVAAKALRRGETAKKGLYEYERRWRESPSAKDCSNHALVRKIFLKLSDPEMDRVAKLLNKILDGKDPSKVDPMDVAKQVITSDPGLLLLGRHLLSLN
jgi:digeranylgeranylglycerophospholipid reductase